MISSPSNGMSVFRVISFLYLQTLIGKRDLSNFCWRRWMDESGFRCKEEAPILIFAKSGTTSKDDWASTVTNFFTKFKLWSDVSPKVWNTAIRNKKARVRIGIQRKDETMQKLRGDDELLFHLKVWLNLKLRYLIICESEVWKNNPKPVKTKGIDFSFRDYF